MVSAGTEVFVRQESAFDVPRRKHPWGAESAETQRMERKPFLKTSFCLALLCVLCVSAYSASKEVKQKVRTP
jgi:hypothetical protein